MAAHPNVVRAQAGFEAFARGDFAAIAELIDEHATWRVRGRSAVAGEHRGRDAIFAFLARTAELSGGTYRVEPRWIVGDDEHVVAIYRASGAREGRTLDLEQVLLVRVAAGRWVEIDAIPFDQYAFDEFWS